MLGMETTDVFSQLVAHGLLKVNADGLYLDAVGLADILRKLEKKGSGNDGDVSDPELPLSSKAPPPPRPPSRPPPAVAFLRPKAALQQPPGIALLRAKAAVAKAPPILPPPGYQPF